MTIRIGVAAGVAGIAITIWWPAQATDEGGKSKPPVDEKAGDLAIQVKLLKIEANVLRAERQSEKAGSGADCQEWNAGKWLNRGKPCLPATQAESAAAVMERSARLLIIKGKLDDADLPGCLGDDQCPLNETRPEAVKRYWTAASTNVTNQCTLFFDSLDSLSSTSGLYHDLINTGFSYTALMAGIARASQRSLTYLAGAQGVFNDSSRTLQAYYLLSPSPRIVKTFTLNRMQTRLAAIDAEFENTASSAGGYHYPIIKRRLSEYAEMCSIAGIKTAIDQVLSEKPENLTQIFGSNATQIALQQLQDLIDRQQPPGPPTPLSLPDTAILFDYLVTKAPKDGNALTPGQSAEREALLSPLPQLLRQRIQTVDQNKDTSIRKLAVSVLNTLDQLVHFGDTAAERQATTNSLAAKDVVIADLQEKLKQAEKAAAKQGAPPSPPSPPVPPSPPPPASPPSPPD